MWIYRRPLMLAVYAGAMILGYPPPTAEPQLPTEAADQSTANADEAAPVAKPPSPTAPEGHQRALLSEESLTRFHRLLWDRPLHGPAFAGLVKHYAEQGRLEELVSEYEQRVHALPDDQASRIILARLYLRTGKAEQAAERVDQIDRLGDGLARSRSRLLVFKSEVYQRVGRTEGALRMLRQALEEAETLSERLRLSEAVADLHLRAQQPEKAAEALTRLSTEFPENYFHRKRIADALAQRDLHQQAVEQYRQILDLVEQQTDKRCEVLRQLGRSLERLGKRQQAIDAYTQAIQLLHGDHWLLRDLHERVVTLYRAAGELDDLVQYCRDSVARSPEQTSMYVLLAEVLVAAGQPEEAKKTLARAVELFPKDPLLSERRIGILEQLDDRVEAAAEFERAISQHPARIELYVSYGQFLARHKQLEAARNQWKHVLNRELTDATLALRLGTLFEQYELLDDAVECYERAITLSPDRSEGYAALSRLWLFRGKKDLALAALRRMGKANPDDAAIQAELAQSYSGLGLTEEALAALTRASELDPDSSRYQMARADLLVRAGRFDESFQVRRAAINLIKNPREQLRAIEVLVSMSGSAGRLDELREEEQTRLSEGKPNPVSLLVLARIADFERDFGEARRYFQELLRVDPSHEEGRRGLARLYEAVGDIDAAVAEYRTLIGLHPTRSRSYYQAIADLKLRYHDKAGAIETFDQMVQASPDNATVLTSVAEQLVRLEELEQAIRYYEHGLQLQPQKHETRLAYAKALKKAGRLQDALIEFKRTALQSDDRDSSLEALGQLHETAGVMGQLDALLEELETRVEEDPSDTVVARTLADLLIREYEYTRAMELLDLLLKHYPRDAGLRLGRANLLRRLTRFDEAIEEYQHVLRYPLVDRDYVAGEMGKAYFEAGQIEPARQTWKRINNKLYAGTLLRNNGLLDEAIDVFQEGIRLKPDDFALHRNLVRTYELAGRLDDALGAARRLLDLDPTNTFNIKQVAKAYLEQGDREAAAEVAARLFGASVVSNQPQLSSGHWHTHGQMPLWAASLASSWWASGVYWHGPARTNLEQAVEFFRENGLMAELAEILLDQIERQPENAVLRLTAARLFSDDLGRPELALKLLSALETAEFPLEHRLWLGQCSQRDYFRVQQYQLIASKPALRDSRLTALEKKTAEELTRDERIELAVIRHSQGATDDAVDLLKQAVGDRTDQVPLSMLVDVLARAERFAEAEPYVLSLIDLLTRQRQRMQAEMVERVRRDFVRTLPMQFQLRVTDELLRDIAQKWTLGQGFLGDLTGLAQTMGYYRARMTLATIYAETGRIEEARKIWQDMEPRHPADADGWTMLAAIVQYQGERDLAYRYYERALRAAKRLAADPLLEQIYGSSATGTWFGGSETFDASFNAIIEAFAGQEKLVELYDFLRETDQVAKARRVAEQYDLYAGLQPLYREAFEQARQDFLRSGDDPLTKSVPYFMHACKLAELYDWSGDWPRAQQVYEQYLEDFPNEVGLLTTLSEVAEATGDYSQALHWEKQAVEAKERMFSRARDWALRRIFMTPSIPQALAAAAPNQWSWQQRWGKNPYWAMGYYGSQQGHQLETVPSWMRIARLYLAMDNSIGAADAMQRAISAAGTKRNQLADEILTLIKQRQLMKEHLAVLRMLAVYLPADEPIQLTFAESLEANDRPAVAIEVYRRLLRRGVTDIDVLTQIRRKLAALDPQFGDQTDASLASLEAEVAADPNNANQLLRLARAYYYSLRMDEALETAGRLREIAPHLEGLQDLLIEIYTLREDHEKLLAALRTKIQRAADDESRQAARHRLVDELFSQGRIDEALEELTKLADPRDPSSYQRVGALLHYFGRHDEAIRQFELATRSQALGGWGHQETGQWLAKAFALKGDFAGAAEKMLEAIEDQIRQTRQFGGMAGLYSLFQSQENYFQPFTTLFVMHPEILQHVRRRLLRRHESNPRDIQAARLLMQLYRHTGQDDEADAILDKMAAGGAADHRIVTALIDRAVTRGDYAKATKMAEDWLTQQPKPQLPPGIPPQLVAMMSVMSERNLMLCKLADIYWKMGRIDKAFETYRQILDDKVEQTKLAYAAICTMRDRIDEARTLVGEALAKQQVKSPTLLQFRALLAIIDGDLEESFDYLAESVESSPPQGQNPFTVSFGGGQGNEAALLAALALQTGQVDRFVAFMQQRIEKNPNEWERHRLLAETLRNAGRTTAALEVLDRAARVKTLKREVLQWRIAWLEGHAPAEQLIPWYTELIELSEKQVRQSDGGFGGLMSFFGAGQSTEDQIETQPLRDRLGDLLWETGQHETAREVWTARMDALDAASHVALAERYMQKEAARLAEDAFQKALELEPSNQVAHHALARLAHELGDDQATLEHMRELFLARFESTASDSQSERYRSSVDDADRDLRRWALDIVGDAEVMARLRAGTTPQDVTTRLMLAVLVGDWSTAEKELQWLLDFSPYDPMGWTLQALIRERAGRWADAVEAWRQVIKLKKTTIPQRRHQLQLVLAEEQLKTATAGQRAAGPASAVAALAATGAMQVVASHVYPDWRYGGSSDETSHLAGLYIRLKEYEKAEHLYLRGEEDFHQYTLPALASLMRRQGAGERALELSRLALVLSGDLEQTGGYANGLAESGQVRAAVDLLIRAYRLSEQRDSGSFYQWMSPYFLYGTVAGDGDDSFENYQQQQMASALYEILQKTGRLDEELPQLEERLARAPDDVRLGKLLVSLQIKAGRWKDARRTLEALARNRPEDVVVRVEQLDVALELHDWDTAVRLAQELRDKVPTQTGDWAMREAFAHLMKGDSDRAVAAVAPLLDRADPSQGGIQPIQVYKLYLAAGKVEELGEALQSRYERGQLDEPGQLLLCAIYRRHEQWEPALRLAVEQFWRQPALSEGSPWYQALHRILLEAGAGAVGAIDSFRPEDRSLLTLVSEGPAVGKRAFQKLLAEQMESLDGRRGLLLAALMDGDAALARDVNQSLIEWLEPRRQRIWQPAQRLALDKRIRAFVNSVYTADLDSQAVLGVSVSFAQMLGQILQMNQQTAQAVTYGSLWSQHQRLHRELLLRSGEVDDYIVLLKAQSRRAAVLGDSERGYGGRMSMMRQYMGGFGYMMGHYDYATSDSSFEQDWREPFKEGLHRYRLFGPLVEHLQDTRSRSSPQDWLLLAEAFAARGQRAEANRWSRRWMDHDLAELRAADAPDIGAVFSWYDWGWHEVTRSTHRLRNALQVSLTEPSVPWRGLGPWVSPGAMGPSSREAPPPAKLFHEPPDELWEWALIDPNVESKLLELAAGLGPEWGGSDSLDQLISYYEATEQPEKIVELLERVFGSRLLRSERLDDYLKACYRARNYAAIRQMLDAVVEKNARLADAVLLERLMLLKHEGKDQEAQALESELISRCKTEPPNPYTPDPQLLEWLRLAGQSPRPLVYAYPQAARWLQDQSWSVHWFSDPEELATLPSLAEALGISYTGLVTEDDLTLQKIRMAYARHGFYRDAARIADRELTQQSDSVAKSHPVELLKLKAQWLDHVGEEEAAGRVLRQVESALRAQAEEEPNNAKIFKRLAELYASEAFGPDYERGYEAYRRARDLDPAFDPTGVEEAWYLDKLGRYDEAWQNYRLALTRCEWQSGGGAALLYRAGLAADRAGREEFAASLLRQALWRNPLHPLAREAKELIHGR